MRRKAPPPDLRDQARPATPPSEPEDEELPPIRWLCGDCGRILKPPYDCKHCQQSED